MEKIKVWVSAFRLRTLPLALASIAMGGFLAAYYHAFNLLVFILSVVTTIFLQILSNLANDYGDFRHGADSPERKGPTRSVQSGAISPEAMKKALYLFCGLSFFSGIALLYFSIGFSGRVFLFFLALGLLAIMAAIAYTNGKRPYGYAGLGDISVLLFFGLIGVLGALYLHTQHIQWPDLLPALSCGLFATGVLNINNIRDIHSDAKAGKYTIPVRIGRKKAVYYHWTLLLLGLAVATTYGFIRFEHWSQYLFILPIPLFVKNALAVRKYNSEEALDPYLRQLAISSLLFVVALGAGHLL